MKKLSVVSPVFNEEGNLVPFYEQLISVLKKLACEYEIIFVNDCSTDNSAQILVKLSTENENVKLINFSKNFGHQAAITAGIDNASGDAVVILDSDLQDPPMVINELYAKWLEGYDVVNAKRKSRQDSFLKTLTATMFYKLLNGILTSKLPENVGDFRLLDRKVINVLKELQEKDRYLRGLSVWVGFKQCEVEFNRDKRYSGKTHYTFVKMFNLAFDAIFSFSKFPMRLALLVSILFMIISIVLTLYSIFSWTLGHVVAGWTSVVFIISLLSSLQMFVLAVISEYVGRIYTQTQNRPIYIIASKKNF